MILPWLLGCVFWAAIDPPLAEAPAAGDLAAYREARSRAGHDADAQVKLALWCEAHELTAERIKHLSLATLIDPANTAARGLLGLISYQGKWQRPDQVSHDVTTDPASKALVQEYMRRRAKAPDKADDQWKLALWCEQSGLNEQALAHLNRVVQLDPRREAAWRRLGYKKTGSRWAKPELLIAEKAELEAQVRANKFWKPRLEHLRESLGGRDRAKRALAVQAIGQITDPRAVPSVWAVLARGSEADQRTAVQVLGQIDAPGASRGLCLMSLFSPFPEIRGSTVEILRRRDPREFAGLLVGMIRDRIKYKVNSVGGPGSPGVVTIEGDTANSQRRYSPPPAPTYVPAINDTVFPDAYGQPVVFHPLGYYPATGGEGILSRIQSQMSDADRLPFLLAHAGLGSAGQQLGARIAADAHSRGAAEMAATESLMKHAGPTPAAPHGFDTVQLGVPYLQIPIGQMMAASQATAVLAQRQLETDVKSIEDMNTMINESNSRALFVLNQVSGQSLGADRTAWDRWITDLKGYAYVSPSIPVEEKPTVVEEVPLTATPQPSIVLNTIEGPLVNVPRHSCFAAGTLVRTFAGLRTVEELGAGDLVLSRDTATGMLSYLPVLVVYHNPPNATFRIDLGGESIVATGIHRFWKAGQGWVMTRDLKPGDRLRTVGGTLTVRTVQNDKVQNVFNLQLAGGDDFFVGKEGVLAHDNSLVNPAEKPFDRVPSVEEIARR